MEIYGLPSAGSGDGRSVYISARFSLIISDRDTTPLVGILPIV